VLIDDDSAPTAQRAVTLLNERSNAQIYAAILTQGPLSRTEVSRLTGFSQSTITKAVQPMIGDGYLVEGTEQQAGVGRPQVPLRVNNARHTVVGIKLARDEVIGVVIDLGAEVLAAQHRKLADRSVETAVEAIRSVTASLFANDPDFARRAVGIGIGVGGHVDGRIGMVRESPILGWHDVPLGDLVEAAVGLPAVVENDVNALAVAEQWFGAGRDVDWFAVVTVGAGVGCGLVLDGTLAHGATGAAGELGHVTIDPDGAPCSCGKRGCVETIATDGAILAAIRAAGGPDVDSMTAAAALAREGDAHCRAAFTRAGDALGQAVALVLNLVNPTRVVLSGEGIAASDLMLDSLRASMARHAFSSVADCELVTRPLADETWARGAATTVVQRLVSRPRLRRPASPPGDGR
jgi:predicted NBD/HSP70 family sugar kinase